MFEKKQRTLNDVGKKNYNFDFELEKNIYLYLCCKKVKKKVLKQMKDNIKFESYMEWERYVSEKYTKYPSMKLIEFSRYLNLRKRDIKPIREYWMLVSPIVVTIIITYLIETLGSIQKINYEGATAIVIVTLIVVLILMIGYYIYLFWKMLIPIWDNHIEENLFTDYKEIIDRLIEEKKVRKDYEKGQD